MFEDNKISIIDEYNQIFEFITDDNGDYYFMLFSFNKNGNYFPFIIDEQHPSYNFFKHFIIQEMNFMKNDRSFLYKNPYFVVNDNSVRIYNQNKHIKNSEYVEFNLLNDKISIIFNKVFPASIRITAIGRMDFYPFFIPVIDLFNSIINNEPKTKSKRIN